MSRSNGTELSLDPSLGFSARPRITSRAFHHDGFIPSKYTCEGEGVSPPLCFEGIPSKARSIALVVNDPDAPDPAAPALTWTHWVLYDLPPGWRGLPEGVRRLPDGAREGTNDWRQTGYRGPCPLVGNHRYYFILYVLDTRLGDLGVPNARRLARAMAPHVISTATLVGRYERGNLPRVEPPGGGVS